MTILALALAVLIAAAAPAAAGNWNVPAAAKHLRSPVVRRAATLAAGQALFEARCVRCHGPEGAGDGTAGERPEYDLRTILPGLTDGELFWKVTHGVGKMPSFAGILTEEERWLVVHHMRTFVEPVRAGVE